MNEVVENLRMVPFPYVLYLLVGLMQLDLKCSWPSNNRFDIFP